MDMEDNEDWPMGKILIVAVLVVAAVMAIWWYFGTKPMPTEEDMTLTRAQVVLVCDDGTWVKVDPKTNRVFATKIGGGVMRSSEVSPKVPLAVICSN